MKNLFYTILLICFAMSAQAQWEALESHVSFRTTNTGIDEWTHWTPSDLSFWTDVVNYNTGSSLNPFSLTMFDAPGGFQINRVALDYNGLELVNGASWQYAKLYPYGSGGRLNLGNGSGSRLVELSSTTTTSSNGDVRIYDDTNTLFVRALASSADHGQVWTYGPNTEPNVYIGADGTSDNNGWVLVYDSAGNGQAGIRVDGNGNGIVYGDTKSFKIPHPNKSDTDIWYACIEGPEAAIYDRGTAELVNGEAFVPYSESFEIVSNSNMKTTTIQLTPQEWDTYGLAVVNKTKKGFYVKELKGGTGNYEFDWEAKGVRAGKEDFQVYRPKSFLDDPVIDETPKEEVAEKALRTEPTHVHTKGCVHNEK